LEGFYAELRKSGTEGKRILITDGASEAGLAWERKIKRKRKKKDCGG
jgi:hypothetical protein